MLLHRRADPQVYSLFHSIMRSLPLFWLGRVIPFALINLIPLPCFVDGGPVNGDFWDLETISSFPDFDVAPPADLWFNDASTDVDFLSWPDFPDSSPEFDDGTDPFLASNPSCHADADADLTQFEPYSKLRARQACPAPNQPDPPPLAVPSLDSLGSPDDGSANAGTLNELFRIVPDLPTTAHDSEQEQKTCPADRTFNSKVPVCDSGKMLDTHTVPGLAYSTLYNVQPCGSHIMLLLLLLLLLLLQPAEFCMN